MFNQAVSRKNALAILTDAGCASFSHSTHTSAALLLPSARAGPLLAGRTHFAPATTRSHQRMVKSSCPENLHFV